jgi:hypothetical protein
MDRFHHIQDTIKCLAVVNTTLKGSTRTLIFRTPEQLLDSQDRTVKLVLTFLLSVNEIFRDTLRNVYANSAVV